MNIIIQGVGFLALLFVILSFQKNKRGLILLYLVIAQTIFAIHFGLLEAWTAVVINVIAAIRTYIFYAKDTQKWAKSALWYYFFIFTFGFAGFIVWEGYHSLLPISAVIIDTFAQWKKDTKSIRFIMLMPRPLWFIYNFIVGSQAGMITEVIIVFSIVLGILRFDVLKKKNPIDNSP